METITELNVKGMVCNRCILTIREQFLNKGYLIGAISLGKVEFDKPIDASKKEEIRQLLSALGFELISDKNQQLLSKMKAAVETWSEQNESGHKSIKLSDYLSDQFNKSYDSLSEFFSRYEEKTIEKYFLDKRMDKVKELLVYTDLSLSEIAFKTGFSSAHHLSSQFKKLSGFNPSELRDIRRG